jgi:hypothetical protein
MSETARISSTANIPQEVSTNVSNAVTIARAVAVSIERVFTLERQI